MLDIYWEKRDFSFQIKYHHKIRENECQNWSLTNTIGIQTRNKNDFHQFETVKLQGIILNTMGRNQYSRTLFVVLKYDLIGLFWWISEHWRTKKTELKGGSWWRNVSLAGAAVPVKRKFLSTSASTGEIYADK